MKKNWTRLLCGLCTAGLLGGLLVPTAMAASPSATVADWHFDEASIKSGSLAGNDLILRDQSGNGNDLVLNGNGKKLAFSADKMYEGTGGSLQFNNPKGMGVFSQKSEFLTDKNAPINKNNFSDGYTIELIYQLPADFTQSDKWMGLLSRKGDAKSMTEKSGVSLSLAVSNCKELQFQTANKDDSHTMDSVWSVTMDKGGVWYHIAIISDGQSVRTYVNGCEAFRDYEGSEMPGLFADPSDGRFCIGGFDSGVTDHAGRGAFQQVRISSGALDRAQWLVSNPEAYIGQYGTNDSFRITAGGAYNIVFLPDIQNAVEFRGEVLDTAMDWMVQNQALTNTAAVLSLGDNVNSMFSDEQWNTAKRVLQKLPEGGIPFLPQPGNHDANNSNPGYLNAFGPESEIGRDITEQFGVVYSPSGYSNYMLFDAGSYRYMMLTIGRNVVDDKKEKAWFEEVLRTHSDIPTIVSSHEIADCDEAAPEKVHLSADYGQKIWKMVKKYNQVFLMVGGHFHGAGEETLVNDSGNPVYNILADYQFAYNGGNAFFKFAEFDEAHNEIKMSTFSPYAATLASGQRTFFDVNYMTGPGNYSVFPLDFSSRFAGMRASAGVAEQQKLVALVRAIDALPDVISLADRDNVMALIAQFNALPEDVRADFANSGRLLDARQTIWDIEAGKIPNPETTAAPPAPETAAPSAENTKAQNSADTGDSSLLPAAGFALLAGAAIFLLSRKRKAH